ncbi:MAG: LLM class flavin-dependent oxidoreductase [Clostridia bacterium]|nr:LLM class flavin-dependent oxidoreductase [Clostridia bacterium]
MDKTIRFGVGFLGDADVKEIVSNARLAEDMGFATCWVAEDYFCGGAFSIAAACAAHTQRIRVAIGVLNPYTRHPALSAMEAAALYRLSNGRLEVAIGASNKLWIEKQMGIPFAKPLSSVRDTVAIMRGVFAGEKFSYHGEAFSANDILPRTSKCEALPLLLGVKSEKMLHMAGQIADGVLLSVGTSANYVRWVKEELQKGAAVIGRDIKDYRISAYLIFSIDEDRELARSKVKTKLAYYLGLHGDNVIMQQAGIAPELLTAFREGFLRGAYRTDLVTDEIIDALSVSGNPKECRQKLQALLDAGVTEPVLFQIPEIPVEENLGQIKTYLM